MKKAILLTLLFIQSYSVIHAQLPSSGTYVWKAADEPKIFNNKLQLSFVQGSNGFPQYGTVLAGGGYNTTQDGAVFQLYFPYSEVYGGNAPKLRLGRYNNAGWSNWETFFTSANANKSTIDWSSKTLFVNDKIGIGTSVPSNPITIQKISGGTGFGGSDGTGGVRVRWSTGYGIALDAWDGGTPRWGITKYSQNTPMVMIEGHYNSKDVFFNSGGNVGIGTTAPSARLDVNGNLAVQGSILASRVKVAVPGGANWNWADYVFDKNYKLTPLHEVEKYIQQNKHLPNIPSAEQIVKEGIDLGQMNARLLEKIEELTLYMIEIKKENGSMLQKIEQLTTEVNNFKKAK